MTSMLFFFFNDTATTEIYTLSLHDALPIWRARRAATGRRRRHASADPSAAPMRPRRVSPRRDEIDVAAPRRPDRKSTRLNSSHANISYAVFCLKKKNNNKPHTQQYTNIIMI